MVDWRITFQYLAMVEISLFHHLMEDRRYVQAILDVVDAVGTLQYKICLFVFLFKIWGALQTLLFQHLI